RGREQSSPRLFQVALTAKASSLLRQRFHLAQGEPSGTLQQILSSKELTPPTAPLCSLAHTVSSTQARLPRWQRPCRRTNSSGRSEPCRRGLKRVLTRSFQACRRVCAPAWSHKSSELQSTTCRSPESAAAQARDSHLGWRANLIVGRLS